jgi:hypothetical protein
MTNTNSTERTPHRQSTAMKRAERTQSRRSRQPESDGTKPTVWHDNHETRRTNPERRVHDPIIVNELQRKIERTSLMTPGDTRTHENDVAHAWTLTVPSHFQSNLRLRAHAGAVTIVEREVRRVRHPARGWLGRIDKDQRRTNRRPLSQLTLAFAEFVRQDGRDCRTSKLREGQERGSTEAGHPFKNNAAFPRRSIHSVTWRAPIGTGSLPP